MHILDTYPQLLGDDLGKGGEVSLSLRADPGRHANFATRLNGDSGALIGPNASCLDKRDETDSHVPAFGPQARAFLFYKAIVANHGRGFLEYGLVDSAVQNERCHSLVHD